MAIVQLIESDWKEAAYPVAICTLPLTPAEFSKRYNITFIKGREEGLGIIHHAFVLLGDVPCFLQATPEGHPESHFITVWVHSYQSNSESALQEILKELGLNEKSLHWRAENLGPAQWVLYRIDDNGNEITMQLFLERESADLLKKKYDEKGHKQAYFVRKIE